MRLLERYPELRNLVLSGPKMHILVDVTDAANWLFIESHQERWNLATDFHALTPPHQYTYAEFTIPDNINLGGELTRIPSAGASCGCFLACFEIAEEERETAQSKWLLEQYVCRSIGEKDETVFEKAWDVILDNETWRNCRKSGLSKGILPAFILDAVVYVGGTRMKEPICLSRCTMYLDKTGKVFPDKDGTLMLTSGFPDATKDDIGLFYPFAFALSLMNCKNVEIVDDQRQINRQERRRMERNGQPLVDYKWLHVKQLQRRVEGDMAQHARTGRNRLHFVRSHWATYTSDAPLFGKYKGTYFRPSHVRGNLTAGVALKDYKVDVP